MTIILYFQYYSEEQYQYTIAQYDAYYQQQAELEKEKSHVQDAAQQATNEQTPHEHSKSDLEGETVVESGDVQERIDADKDEVTQNCDSIEDSAEGVSVIGSYLDGGGSINNIPEAFWVQ